MELLIPPWFQQRRQQHDVAQQRPPPTLKHHHNNKFQDLDDDDLYYTQDVKKNPSPLCKILDALNMAILPHDLRLLAVIQASELFDHRDQTRHNYELSQGAARILYQKLAFVLTLKMAQDQIQFSSSSSTNPIDSTTLNNTTTSANSGTSGWNDYFKLGFSAASKDSHHNHNYAYNGTDAISIHRIRSSRSPNSSDADYEIMLLASTLEMVHRASPDAIAQTWKDIGAEALPILLQVIQRPFTKITLVLQKATQMQMNATATERMVSMAANREIKMAVQKVTKVLAVYSLVPEAKVAMLKCPGLLTLLVKITDTQNMNRMVVDTMRPIPKQKRSHIDFVPNITDSPSATDSSTNNTSTTPQAPISSGSNGIKGTISGTGLFMTEASRFNAIAILTNLAAAEPNRMTMLAEPGLVDNIARVVHHERSDVARQCAALAIMNLSNGDREHVPELANNELLLETIIVLMRDDVAETRRNAAIALFNVACADQNTVKLARYKNGIILELLRQLVVNDDDNDIGDPSINDEVRTNSAEALFNIACSSITETTDRMANHPELLESIAITLRSAFASRDVKLYCAATIKRMAEIIHAPSTCHAVLLTAIVKASVWTRTPCIAEAFLSQAKHERNRAHMIEHHGLLNALSKLALNVGGSESDRVRNAAISAIECLSREESTRSILARHEGIMMALTRATYGRSSSKKSNSSVLSDKSDSHDRRIQVALKILVDAM